jgi:hypothetical protein
MKNLQTTLFKALLVLFTIPLLVSCSKDDDTEPSKTDKTIKITVEHTGDVQYYISYLTVTGTLDSDQKGIPVSGVAWDKQYGEGEVTIYEKSTTQAANYTLTTDKKAAKIQFGYSVWYNADPSVQHTPVNVTFKYYLDDKLVKTETYKASESIGGDPYLGELDIANY